MRKILLISFLLIVVSTFTMGCAAFQAQKKINLAPFAENAVSIVSEVEYGLSQARATHIRSFIGGPESENYQAQWVKMGRFLRGIVAYSIQIVTISQSDMSDTKKAGLLADYISSLATPIFADPSLGFKITREEFTSIIENIRNQNDYFQAMNAAQPVVDEVSRLAELVLSDLKKAQDKARLEVANRIEDDHAPVLQYKDELKDKDSFIELGGGVLQNNSSKQLIEKAIEETLPPSFIKQTSYISKLGSSYFIAVFITSKSDVIHLDNIETFRKDILNLLVPKFQNVKIEVVARGKNSTI